MLHDSGRMRALIGEVISGEEVCSLSDRPRR